MIASRIFAAVCPICAGTGQVHRPVRLCGHCRAPLNETDSGRPRLYCSTRCRVAAHRMRQALESLSRMETLAASLATDGEITDEPEHAATLPD